MRIVSCKTCTVRLFQIKNIQKSIDFKHTFYKILLYNKALIMLSNNFLIQQLKKFS